jgi:EAL domain-containing protein (putative c-di-GMP-specific phosphodiesterase class I)/GGDEF domain-containing protein
MLIAAVQDTVFSILIAVVALLLTVGAAFLIRFEQKSYKKSKLMMIDDFVKYPALEKLIDYRLKSKKKKEVYFTLLKLGIDDFDQLREYIGSKGESDFRAKIIELLKMTLSQGSKLAETDEKDAFVIYIPVFIDEEKIEETADLFKQAAEKRVKVLTGIPLQKSASVAVVSYPSQGASVAELMQKLDDAFIYAKKTGGNKIVVASDEIKSGGVYTDRYRQLKKAVADNAVKMAFNPIIDVARNKLIGAEAVLRWEKADGTYMDYENMIPFLEESDDDLWFGLWSLERALVSNVKIFRSENVREFNVNLIAGLKEIENDDAADLLQRSTDKYQVDARNVIFDIKGLPVDNYSKILKNVIQLQALGFKLSICADKEDSFEEIADVYGVEVLKISFNTVLNDAEKAKRIFSYAEKTNKKLFVTDIENKEQLESIRERKAAYAQGVYFGTAKTKEELLDIAENR